MQPRAPPSVQQRSSNWQRRHAPWRAPAAADAGSCDHSRPAWHVDHHQWRGGPQATDASPSWRSSGAATVLRDAGRGPLGATRSNDGGGQACWPALQLGSWLRRPCRCSWYPRTASGIGSLLRQRLRVTHHLSAQPCSYCNSTAASPGESTSDSTCGALSSSLPALQRTQHRVSGESKAGITAARQGSARAARSAA